MRKCKAKSIEDKNKGKWIKGYIVISENKFTGEKIAYIDTGSVTQSKVRVDIDTVCEDTLVQTSKKVKIYENDIVQDKEDKEKYIVTYLDGSFVCKSEKDSKYYPPLLTDFENLRVIGNTKD